MVCWHRSVVQEATGTVGVGNSRSSIILDIEGFALLFFCSASFSWWFVNHCCVSKHRRIKSLQFCNRHLSCKLNLEGYRMWTSLGLWKWQRKTKKPLCLYGMINEVPEQCLLWSPRTIFHRLMMEHALWIMLNYPTWNVNVACRYILHHKMISVSRSWLPDLWGY